MRISVIIPALNEESNIRGTLESSASNSVVDRIVVDGGSLDGTLTIARDMGATIVKAPRGRAVQMNLGASQSTGDTLLFLHCDTRLPRGFEHEIDRILSNPAVLAGAFRLGIEGTGKPLRWIERAVNFRSVYFSLPYGDQALFIRKRAFYGLGGFKDLPIMEDFDMVWRLRRVTTIGISQLAVTTSARRWEKLGPWKTTAINQILVIGYLLGISPQRLLRLYRR